MRRLLLCAVVVLLGSCVDDNDEIKANRDDTFRYTHWSHRDSKGRDEAELHFINESTNQAMTWKGDVRDAMVYLEQIDKDRCYKNPLTRDRAVEMECP